MKTRIVAIVTILFCSASIFCHAQRYHIHPTPHTMEVVTDMSRYVISDCVGGIYLVFNRDRELYYILDTLCNKLGEVQLSDFTPLFYGGKIATAMLKNGHPAIINTNGEVIKEFTEGVRISRHFVDGIALVEVKQPNTYETRTFYINENGDFVYTALPDSKVDELSPLCEGMRRYYDAQNNKYGFIDSLGNIAIPAQFVKVHDFSSGLAAYTSGDGNVEHWGYIDKAGNVVISPMFRTEPGDFHDGYAVVRKHNGKYVFIDKEANVKTREYDRATRFFHGYALVNAQYQHGGPNLLRCYVLDNNFRRIRTIEHFGNIEYNDYNKTFTMSKTVFYPNGEMKLKINSGVVRDFVEDIALASSNAFTGFINSKGEILIYFTQNGF